MIRLPHTLLPVLCTTGDLDVAGATADVFAAAMDSAGPSSTHVKSTAHRGEGLSGRYGASINLGSRVAFQVI
jgi:hypothetical protein